MEEKSFLARLFEKKMLLLVIGGLLLLPIIILGANSKTGLFSRASEGTPGVLKSVEINLPEIKTGISKNSIPLSALAYDANNKPILSGVTYEWGISSQNSIGTLNSTNGNITNFLPLRPGRGDLFVTVRYNSLAVTKSIKVTVGGTGTPLTPTKSSSFCQINSKIPTSQDNNGVKVQIKAEGGPGTTWRVVKNLPFQVVQTGSIVNNKVNFTFSALWGVRYILQIETSPGTWYSGPGCLFFYDKIGTPTPVPSGTSPNGACIPTQISPIKNTKITKVPPTLSWKACTSTSNTKYYYKISVYGGGINWESPVLTSTSYTMNGFTFKPGSNYLWRVRSCTDSSCSFKKVGNWSNQEMFTYVLSTSTPTGNISPTRTPTPNLTLTAAAKKTWYFQIQLLCSNGSKPKSPYNTYWYWWDSANNAESEPLKSPNVAVVTGPVNRTYNLLLSDIMGPLKVKTPPVSTTNNSTYISWSGSRNNSNTIVTFEARASACTGQ